MKTTITLRHGLPYRWWTMDRYRDLLAMVVCVIALSGLGAMLFAGWFLL